MKLKAKLTILLLWGVLPLFAQQSFTHKAALGPVKSDGFYNIELQPDLIAQCQSSLADIRLKDEKGSSVAYLLGNTLPVKQKNNFIELPKVSAAQLNDSLSSFIAENKQKSAISQLWLKLRNTEVNRKLNVLGSDDLKHWFAIKEDIVLQNTGDARTGSFDELLTLPASTYRYLKIQVSNKNVAPVNILQAGIYVKEQVNFQYSAVPIASLDTKNKTGITSITVNLRYAYRVNKIHLEFLGAEYYQRRVQIYQLEGNNKEWLQDAQISSAGSGDIYLSAKAHKLQIVIDNGDNEPLKLKALNVSQAEQSVVAYLKKQHQYYLWFGNTKLNAPVYDLRFFADSLNRTLPIIQHAAIISLLKAKSNADKNQLPAWLLWVAGAIGLMALLVLTLKMTKEVGKSNQAK
jgi:hypothetical protein